MEIRQKQVTRKHLREHLQYALLKIHHVGNMISRTEKDYAKVHTDLISLGLKSQNSIVSAYMVLVSQKRLEHVIVKGVFGFITVIYTIYLIWYM